MVVSVVKGQERDSSSRVTMKYIYSHKFSGIVYLCVEWLKEVGWSLLMRFITLKDIQIDAINLIKIRVFLVTV